MDDSNIGPEQSRTAAITDRVIGALRKGAILVGIAALGIIIAAGLAGVAALSGGIIGAGLAIVCNYFFATSIPVPLAGFAGGLLAACTIDIELPDSE